MSDLPSPAGLKKLGPYEIVRKLGQGGMGTVYEAFDPKLRRKVALKVLNAGSTEPEDVLRFMREAESVARLRHPHCIHIYEMGSADGLDYFTMDLIEGVTLDRWAEEKKPSPREVATIIEKVAHALQHAHENGVIHRDIKPSNIMVDAKGKPVLRQGLKDPLLDACREALKSGIEGEDLRASASAEARLDGRHYLTRQERFALPGRLHWYLITAFER
ncbi:MAG: serine/threonine protein kinase [Planctomycetota bacterium]|nr:serine/threonine protein kinase [Planctomycetota bacterium]